MRTFVEIGEKVRELLRCPLCKSVVRNKTRHLYCAECGSSWPLVDIPGGRTYDFRIRRPSYFIPQTERTWLKFQKIQVDHDAGIADHDSLSDYLSEIDSVREIYEREFQITGSVLDVGGHQGRLRHFLSSSDLPWYVSVDPFIDVFQYTQRSNLLTAYPCLLTPCNFVACYAENLSFASACFDWVHMRSVLDHFADAYFALKEAYRVLRSRGRLLIGLSIVERLAANPTPLRERALRKLRNEGPARFIQSVGRNAARILRPPQDDHIIRLSYNSLLDLISSTGFEVVKEHWQKPPYSHVLYISAKKRLVD